MLCLDTHMQLSAHVQHNVPHVACHQAAVVVHALVITAQGRVAAYAASNSSNRAPVSSATPLVKIQ
jgi:hypothetical protein